MLISLPILHCLKCQGKRAVIDALHFEGKSSRSIALVLNRDHSGISKYLKKRDEEKKRRPGAPRKLNEAQLRLLYKTASNRVISAPRLKAELQLNVSTKTIPYLHDVGWNRVHWKDSNCFSRGKSGFSMLSENSRKVPATIFGSNH